MIPFDIILDGDGAWPDLKTKGYKEGLIAGLAVLSKGMGSGRPSVALRIDVGDGSVVVAQTSARLFCAAAKAVMTKYPDLFEGE